MSVRRVRWNVALAFLLGIALALPLGLYLGGGERLMLVKASPDGRERLELYQPSRWHRIVRGYGDDEYAIARISDASSGDRLTISPVFYFQGAGAIEWRSGEVAIGMAARFDRRTGQWSVQGED